jgi:hypothetical protein
MKIAKSLLWPALAASIATTAATAADPEASVAAFEAAMRDLDSRLASRTADALASRYRLDHKDAAPDPLLSGMSGRLFLERGQPATALPYLRHADAPDLPAPLRIAAGFARAEAEEAVGEWPAAAATFERLLALPLDPGQQLAARLGLGRVRLADDPSGALTAAEALAPAAPAGRRWEVELLAAQALSLLGRGAEADAAARRAWVDAAEAGMEAAAPMRVALVRAGLAAAAGRREPLIAMLSTANASVNGIDTDLVEATPVCGTEGLVPADFAILGAYTRLNTTQWLIPIAASRPAAAAAFRKALSGRRLLDTTGTPPGGVVFTIRCRTTPSSDYVPAFAADPLTQWFADRGLYFPLAAEPELEDINRLSNEIAELTAKYGEGHLAVLPLQVSLLMMLEQRASSETDVAEWQVVELRRKIAEALARAGGADGFAPDAQAEAERARLEKAGSFDQAMAIYRGSMERLIGTVPPDYAYSGLRLWLDGDHDLPEATRRRVIETLLKRIGGGPDDPVRRALQRRLGAVARKSGDIAAARAAFAAAGLPRDSCAVAETPPAMKEHGIVDDDYPPDAIAPNIAGATVLELDLGADGRVVGSRSILATPSLVFDPLIGTKVPGFSLTPASEGGRPRACRGLLQTIRWRMPEDKPAGPPRFAPTAPEDES